MPELALGDYLGYTLGNSRYENYPKDYPIGTTLKGSKLATLLLPFPLLPYHNNIVYGIRDRLRGGYRSELTYAGCPQWPVLRDVSWLPLLPFGLLYMS